MVSVIVTFFLLVCVTAAELAEPDIIDRCSILVACLYLYVSFVRRIVTNVFLVRTGRFCCYRAFLLRLFLPLFISRNHAMRYGADSQYDKIHLRGCALCETSVYV